MHTFLPFVVVSLRRLRAGEFDAATFPSLAGEAAALRVFF